MSGPLAGFGQQTNRLAVTALVLAVVATAGAFAVTGGAVADERGPDGAVSDGSSEDSAVADGADADSESGEETVTPSAPTEIETWHDLDAMREDIGTLGGEYVLVNDLNETTEGYDEVASASANGGKGFEPIGNRSIEWEGTFDGQGHDISDLVIDRPDEWDVGLFGGVTGAPFDPQVTSVRLVNATVTGDRAVGALVGYHAGATNDTDADVEVTGGRNTGGLVGEMIGGNGVVANATVTGTVTSSNDAAGGLAGQSGANIENASANVTVSASEFRSRAGGLVGWNWGQITDSNASGTVEGGFEVGGLAGYSSGTIERATATGNVSGDTEIGGLVGLVDNEGFDAATVTQSTASGTVDGTEHVGGLVGLNNGAIERTAATGNISGDELVGGLVGKHVDSGTGGAISTSTASGAVEGTLRVGGLVGFNAGTIENTAARGDVTGTERVGALVGLNGGDERTLGTSDSFVGITDRSYATGTVSEAGLPGGLVGAQELNESALTNAYWDRAASGLDDAIGNWTGGITANVDGLTTAEMQGSTAASTMPGFDFGQVWTTGAGAYPALQDDPTTAPASTGTLTGTVTDAATGDSIAGAPVVVADDAGVVLGTTATGTDGTYTLSAETGATTLLVTADGYGEVVRDVTVTDGETTTEDVPLQEAAPFFGVGIDEDASDLLVTEGETISVVATVENNGTVASTQTVELARFDGQTVDSTTLTLDSGANETVELDWPTATDAAGEGDLAVTTENDSASAPAVVVGQNEGYYDVSVTETSVAAAGTALTVDALVENRGDGTDTQRVTLAVLEDASAGTLSPGAALTEVDSVENLELAAGTQQAVTLTWETTRPDIGNQTLAVASEDVEVETETAVVPSVEPRFEVAIEDLDAAVRPGETLTAVVAVDNAGATGDTQEIALQRSDDELDSTDLTLPAAGRDTVELTWTPTASDTGRTDLSVATENDSASEAVAVLEAGIGYRDVTVSDQQVPLGTSITVTATVENTDTVTRSYDAPVTVDTGVVETVAGELGAGDSETISTAIRIADDGEQPVSVGDADAVTVTVENAWAQDGLGDGNTGHSEAASGPTGPVEAAWSASLDGTPTDPVVVDGRAYVGDDSGTVHAVDADAGTTAWSESLESPVTAGLAVDGDRIYAGTESGLVALDTSGSQQWETPLSGAVTGVTRSNDAVYVGIAGGSESVSALDASTGDEQWSFASGDAVGAPAVAGKTVYVGIGGTVHALAADPTLSEREQWSAAVGDLAGGPAHDSGTVYVGTAGGDPGVSALDAETGTVDWTTGTDAAVVGSPAVAERVYVGQDDGTVRALDSDGATEWTFQTTGTGIDGSPAVVDGVVSVSVADTVKQPRLVGVDAESGTQTWSHETTQALSTGPAVLDGAVYAGHEGGTLLAVREQTAGPILDVESISVSESQVSTGDDVEVNVTVTNIGSSSSEFEIETDCQLEGTLFDCGVLVERIDPGETATFSISSPVLSQRGEFFVIVDGTAGSRPITVTPPGSINGTVTDSQTGDPLDETNVTAEWQVGGRGVQTVEADVTDEGGEYAMPDLRPRTYLVRFDRDGYVPETEFNVPVRSGQTTTVDVELDEEVWITGTLERPDGSLAENHTVSADEMIPEAINVTNRTRTGPDGSFRLGVPAGEAYALVASEQSYPGRVERYFPENDVADLYASQTVNLTDADPGDTVDVGTVQFPEGYNVNVTVVDGAGDPVVGADVVWRDFNGETFGDFHWLGTNFDGVPGGSFDDPGVELPAGPAEVVVETPWGDRVVRSLDIGTDQNLTVEPAPELANRSSFEIQNLTVEAPQFAGDRVTASARIRNVGLVSDTQTIRLDVAGTDTGITQQRTLQTGENTTVTFEWPTSRGDAGQQTFIATTANDTASESFDVIAPDRPYFDVAFRNAELVEEGERMNLTARVSNLAAVGGTQDVRMRIDGTPVDRVPGLDLGPEDETLVTLTWNTEVGDGGIRNVTVATDDQTENDTLELLGAADPQFQVRIDSTNAPVTEGNALDVDATVENTGGQGSQSVTLALKGVGTASTAVTLAGGASTTETLSIGTERGDAGSHVATVSSADDTATRVVSVIDPSPDEGEINLTLDPASATVAPGDTQTYNVTVEDPDAGVSAYSGVAIEVEDRAIANITGFTESRTGGIRGSEIRDGGGTLFLEQALLDAYDPSAEVTIATFTARHVGSADESTALTFNQSARQEVTNESDRSYPVNGFNDATLSAGEPADFQVRIDSTNAPVVAGETLNVSATVENGGEVASSQTVELDVPGVGTDTRSVSLAGGASTTETLSVGVGACGTYDLTVGSDDDDAATTVEVWASGLPEVDLTGDGQPARDTTCDGRLNNIRGDDQFTILDVQSLFNNLDNPLVQNNVDRFQFQPRPDPEEVTILDVQGLFNELEASG